MSSNLTPASPSRSLTDRVKNRVTEARRGLDQRTAGGGPKSKRLRATRLSRPTSRLTEVTDADHDTRSLRRVYGELKTTYQQYRRETGRPPLPELRDAVHAFKRGPSLTSLVGVASFLDDRGLLAW